MCHLQEFWIKQCGRRSLSALFQALTRCTSNFAAEPASLFQYLQAVASNACSTHTPRDNGLWQRETFRRVTEFISLITWYSHRLMMYCSSEARGAVKRKRKMCVITLP